jgi:hypothetical protein
MNPLAALIAAACNPDVWLAGWCVGFVTGAASGLVVVTGAAAYTVRPWYRAELHREVPPESIQTAPSHAVVRAAAIRPGPLASD